MRLNLRGKQIKDQGSDNLKQDRDLLVTYLLYAYHDVAEISPAGATYLLAAISELEFTLGGLPKGNTLHLPS